MKEFITSKRTQPDMFKKKREKEKKRSLGRMKMMLIRNLHGHKKRKSVGERINEDKIKITLKFFLILKREVTMYWLWTSKQL